MVSFRLVAATIVAALTTSVVAAPIPVYIGAVRVGEKPDNVPRAVLPRGPIYIGATRNGNAPQYGTRKRDVEARHAKNIIAFLANAQAKVAAILPAAGAVSVQDTGDEFHKTLTDLQKFIVHSTLDMQKMVAPTPDTIAANVPLLAALLNTIRDFLVLAIGKTANTEMGVFSDFNCLVHAVDNKFPGVATLVPDLSVSSVKACVIMPN